METKNVNEAERILEDSMYDRLMPKATKQGFWDHVFAPRHKVKREEKHSITKTTKTKDKCTIKEYYP